VPELDDPSTEYLPINSHRAEDLLSADKWCEKEAFSLRKSQIGTCPRRNPQTQSSTTAQIIFINLKKIKEVGWIGKMVI